MRLYAIGDIHGQLEALRAAHDRVFHDGGRDALIVHVGDLIDRGPDSRGVVEYLLRGQDRGENWIVLRGNHDRMLSRYLRDPGWIDPGVARPLPWTLHPTLGAAETLASYGVDSDLDEPQLHAEALRAVPADHAQFLDARPLWFLHPLALFVHAGIRPGVDLQDQAEHDLVWIRKPFLDSLADHGPLIIHGHTAIDHPIHYGNRVNIDGGAGWGRPLAAVAVEATGLHLLTDQGRQPLRPVQVWPPQ